MTAVVASTAFDNFLKQDSCISIRINDLDMTTAYLLECFHILTLSGQNPRPHP